MWKKIIVAFISLAGIFSVVYATSHELNAEIKDKLAAGDKFTLGAYKSTSSTTAYTNLSWLVVDVKDNIALAIEETGGLDRMTWSSYCTSESNCTTKGYAQKNGGTYLWMNGGYDTEHSMVVPPYREGIGFVEDFKSTLTGNEFMVGETVFMYKEGFVSDPFLMTLEDYVSVSDKTLLYPTETGIGNNWYLATAANDTQIYMVDGLGTANGYTGLKLNGSNSSRKVRPSIRLDLSKLNIKVEDLKITYTPTPQDGLSTYKYSENVNIHENDGDKVGEISYQDGAGTPTLTIVADPNAPSGHEMDYSNFELNTTQGTSPVDVLIKNNAPAIVNNSLKAGAYYFRVTGLDENDNPSPAPYQDVILTVEKSDKATLNFSETNTIYKKIGDPVSCFTMKTSNTDVLKESDILYTLNGGANGALSVSKNQDNPLQYNLSVPKSFNFDLPTTFTLSVTIKETDNFKAISTTTNQTIQVASNPYKLTYTKTHGNKITDNYLSGSSGNVNVGNSIGSGIFTSDVSEIQYQVISPSSAKNDMTSYKMLDADADGNVSVKSGSDSYNYLLPNVYYYRVQGHDVNNQPNYSDSGVTKPIDTNFNPISDAYDQSDALLTYGMLSDDIEMVVYPNDTLLDYTQSKNTMTSTYMTKAQLNALSGGAEVGTLTFQNDANINVLKAKGYTIKGIKLVKKGTTTLLTEIEVNANSDDVNSFKIQKKNGGFFSGGDISFDAIIEFEKEGSVVSHIKKSNMTFIVPEGLQFVDPDNPKSFLTSSTYHYTYDASSSSHDFILTATDKTSTSSLNPNISYCILDASNICTSSSSVIALSDGAPSGSQKITVSAPGTSNQFVNVRASLKDASNTLITYEDIVLTIQPTTQILSWSGTNIAKTGNDVKLKSGSSDTYEISMRYSGSGVDSYPIEELLNTATAASGNLGVSSNVASGSLTLSYKPSYTNASDNTKVYLSGDIGEKVMNVAGNPTGKLTIEVDSGAVGDYTKSDSIFLEVSVKPSLSLKYTPLYTGSISASSGFAEANAVLGDIQVQPTTETGYTYSITSITSGGVTLSGTYSINPMTGQLKVGENNLAVGSYDVNVQASKDGDSTSETYTIIVVNAAFPITSWKWQEDSSGSYKDVGGNFDSAFVNTTSLSDTYEASKSIQVRLNGVDPSANVVYSLDGTTTGVIRVTDKGSYAIIDILGASPLSSDVKIKATVSDPNGVYTTQDVWIPVDIKKYPQKIKFQDASNLYLPNTAPCTQIPVVKDSTYWNQSGANPVILSTTSSAFTVNGDKICPVSGQSVTGATLTANLNGDGNFDAASAITKTIHIYDPGTITVTQSIDSISGGASNVVYTPGTILEAMNNSSTNLLGSAKKNAISANVKLSGIASSSSNAYVLSTNTGNSNIDAPLFTVAPNGNIALNQDISASDLMAHGSNLYKIQVDVKDVHNYTQTVDVHIKINDAQPDFYFTDAMASALPLNDIYVDGKTSISSYDETYVKNGTFDVYTNNSGAITYKVDTSDPLQASDVISQTSAQLNGSQFTFEHATEVDGSGIPTKKAYIEACVGAQNGYQAKCIYSVVNVKKADQKFKFAANPIVMGINTANFTPVYTGHLDSEPVLITNSTDPTVVDGEAFASEQLTDQNLKTFAKAGKATITAMAQGDRDYNSTTATTVVDVTSRPPTTLTLNATPGATMIYGETSGKVSIRTGYVNSKPAYFWSDDTSIIDINDSNTQNDDSGTLQIHKAGTTIINVCQTSDPAYIVGNACPSGDDYGYIQVSIQKADITLKYSDQNIKTGEALPNIRLEATPISGSFKGSDSITNFPIPASASYRQNSTPLLDSSTVGTYNITGNYNTTEAARSIIENYNVTFDNGALQITQDTSQANWFHLENVTDDSIVDGTSWYNHDLNVVVDTANTVTYDEISLNKSSWSTTPILYDNEGSHSEDVYFRSSTSQAFSTSQSTTMKIDKTKPEITSITGISADRNALQELLNALTFGKYFKPELEVSIKADDILPNGVNENSKLKIIHYEAFQLKDDGTLSDVIASGEMKATDVFNLVDEGMYMVCATAEDNAGNISDEKCSGIRIHEIGEDSDDDGIPDLNIDTNGDGEPDINITKNPGDKKPWVNIDTDGDGEPDMNIDRDGDRIPYLNTGIISEWTCDLPGDIDDDGIPDYKTSSTLKGLNNIDSDEDKHPDINIDLKLTGLPTLNINTDGTLENAYTNIDGDGDGIADINIDKTGDGIPEDKIMKIPSWVPNHDVKENGKVRYDTMELVYEEKDELEDNGIIIKPGKDNPSFLPNYALKVDDITSTLDEETKHTIITITGEKSDVKQVFDVSLTDGDKVIQPNGSILVKIPVDTSIKNPRVLLRNEAGEFKEVEVVIEDGYFVFETEHLGMVSIIGDKEEVVLPDPIPDDPKEPVETPKDPVVPQQPSSNKDSSVKGTYTNGGVGGVSTGDQTTAFLWIVTSLSSLIVVIVAIGNQKKRRN